MTQFTSMGLDVSASATGVVILGESSSAVPEMLYEDEIKPKGMTGVDRAAYIVTRIMETIHVTKPDRIVVEGYSLNTKNASSLIPLIEIGACCASCSSWTASAGSTRAPAR
jgi:Holliday junction resolvasome RuvABC endonuclease subunit